MKTFKPHTSDQMLLLHPALQEWLPEGNLALFISDVVAAAVTQETNDKRQLVAMLTEVVANCGELPSVASADSGYFSETAVTAEAPAPADLRFSFRGPAKVQAEWLPICLTHSLLKLFRAGWRPQVA